MTFEIHAIADADCTEINDEILAATDSYQEAKQLAANHSAGIYGAAILDTVTGEVNYGHDWETYYSYVPPPKLPHHEILEAMGADASDKEAEMMADILNEHRIYSLDQISDKDFFSLIPLAVQRAQGS